MDEDELDKLIDESPGKKVIYMKTSWAAKKTILKLKDSRKLNFIFDEDEYKEYLRDIDRLLSVLGWE